METQELASEIKEKKETILNLNSEFVILEQSFQQFECENCKSNRKNILFLPCGDIIVCNECLLNSFKITPNIPILNSTFTCMKCKKQVDQALSLD